MPLAGLVLTDDDVPEAPALTSALIPVAGQTLVEYQVRVAHACGASPVIVLAERVPAPLAAAFERLRADGLTVEIARNAREAADRIHPEEQLLVMAAGIVAARDIVVALTGQQAPALVTLRDSEGMEHYERIDGQDRWGGLALLNGQLLRDTAAMLGDWTLGPTLLRMALQAGISRRPAGSDALLLVQNERDGQEIANRLAQGSEAGGAGFWQAQIVDPAVRRVLPRLLAPNVSPERVSLVPLALMAAAMLTGALGWIAPSFGLFLLSGFPLRAARIMADIAARPDRVLHWTTEARLPLLLALLGFAGWALNRPGLGWGPLALALWAGIALMLQPRSVPREAWLADADLVALELLMASLIGHPVLGLMIAVAHGVLSQFWLVRRLG